MKKIVILLIFIISIVTISSFRSHNAAPYVSYYGNKIKNFRDHQSVLLNLVNSNSPRAELLNAIRISRLELKEIDFWLRYLEPVEYRKINGPLPVEWETEVFEKFEAPYYREGSGLTLAMLELEEENPDYDRISHLIQTSLKATQVFLEDSITQNLNNHHHFYLANRLFILNLAAIYTTGFECPDTSMILPELVHMLQSVRNIYATFNENFPANRLANSYTLLFDDCIEFVKTFNRYESFDHFNFIRKYVNPLYSLNQRMILDNKVRSNNLIDFSLNKNAKSIFDKDLYRAQNPKGIYIAIDDPASLAELKEAGRLLFFDPILSKNNRRSCASCHKPGLMLADTVAFNMNFDNQSRLSRNTPSLVNVIHQQLIMHDGKHFNLENQGRDVITNPDEMASSEKAVLEKVLSCREYKEVFKKYLKATPQYDNVDMDHITSAMILYYSDFSKQNAVFDKTMNDQSIADDQVVRGFNLFMGKAQCGTCHFVPQFNGVKPPYTGSEFEVLGTPADKSFNSLSNDKGRSNIHNTPQMVNAFRTSTVRNASKTMPYMHNGVFRSLEEVIDFYDAGGGAGRGIRISNQTLNGDSLKLSVAEKRDIIAFIHSLNEDVAVPEAPTRLPQSNKKELNTRKPGGDY